MLLAASPGVRIARTATVPPLRRVSLVMQQHSPMGAAQQNAPMGSTQMATGPARIGDRFSGGAVPFAPLDTARLYRGPSRPNVPKVEVQATVDQAHNACEVAAARVIEDRIQPAFREFMEDKIDAAELEERKAAARDAAAQTRATLVPLDEAFAQYEEMVRRRVKLEEELEKAIEDAHAREDAAEQKVQAIAARLLSG